VLRVLVNAVTDFEVALVYSSQQAAEYYADWLAAKIGSTKAAIGLLDRLYLGRQAALAVRFAAQREKPDIWAAEIAYLNDLSAKEWERLRRVQAAEGTGVDSTHPPTNLRIEMLTRADRCDAKLTMSVAESQGIAAELVSGFELVARILSERLAV